MIVLPVKSPRGTGQVQERTAGKATYRMDTAPNETPRSAPREPDACLALCPAFARAALDVIGSKWVVSILVALKTASAPVRYAELRRRIGAITPKELAKHLRALESAGLVGRRVHPTVPPRVEYWLTELGRTMSPVVAALADWGARYATTVHGRRAALAGCDDRAVRAPAEEPAPHRRVSCNTSHNKDLR